MAYDNTNSGALFKNRNKDSDKHPDYTGSINVDGVDYWISGWIKTAGPMARNAGDKFMSLAVNPKEDNRTNQEEKPKPQFDDDDIPF